MQACYTIVFEDFLQEYGNTPEWGEVKNGFATFPDMHIEGVINLNVYNMFVERFCLDEIGFEDISMFFRRIKSKLVELQAKYIDKLNKFNKMLPVLFARDEDIETVQEAYQYLYPVNTQSAKLATKQEVRDKTKHTFGMSKTNAELLDEVLNVRDLYNDLVEEFRSLFIEVY